MLHLSLVAMPIIGAAGMSVGGMTIIFVIIPAR